ncbi:MAG: ester cyclase [Chloroflexi bacterium]|nr:ester cyclase [Chloroflexota bacterium]
MDIIEEMAAAENSHDVERALACFTDDCFFEDVPFGMTARGKQELAASLRMWLGAVPDAHARLASSFVAGDRAAAEVVVTGTHTGDLPGLPATGRRFEIRAVSVLELQQGKVKRRSDYWDSASFLRQLGVMP